MKRPLSTGHHRRNLKYSALILGTGFGYYFLTRLGVLFSLGNFVMTPYWPSAGFAFAAGYLFGVPAFLGIAAGSAASLAPVFLTDGSPFRIGPVLMVLIITLGVVSAVWVFRFLMSRLSGDGQSFRRSGDLRRLILASAAAAVTCATAGSLGVLFFGDSKSIDLFSIWGLWTLGFFSPSILTAPWLISLFRDDSSLPSLRQPRFLGAFLLLVLCIILLHWTQVSWLIYLLIGLVLLGALVFNLSQAGVLINLASMSVLLSSVEGIGIFGRGGVIRTLVPVVSFLTVVALIVYGFIVARMTMESGNVDARLRRRYLSVFSITLIGVITAAGSFEFLAAAEARTIHEQARDSLQRQVILAGKIVTLRYRFLQQYSFFVNSLLPDDGDRDEISALQSLSKKMVSDYDDVAALCYWTPEKSYLFFNPDTGSSEGLVRKLVEAKKHELGSLGIAAETAVLPGDENAGESGGSGELVALFRGSSGGRGVALFFFPRLLFGVVDGLLERNAGELHFNLSSTAPAGDAAQGWGSLSVPVDVGGTRLVATVSFDLGYGQRNMGYIPELVLGFGFLFILLVFSYLLKGIAHQAEVESLVASRTSELQQSRQMLSLIMDNIPMSVFWKNSEGVYLGCNRRFARDAGFSSVNEILGKTDNQFLSADYARFFRREDQRVLQTGESRLNFHEPLPRADGFMRYVRSSKIPILDDSGVPVAVLGLFEDITEERERNVRLENSERKYRALFQNSNDAIVILDAAGDVLEVNESAAVLLGYQKEELESFNFHRLYGNHDDLPQLLRSIRQESQLRNENVLVGRDGREIAVDISASLLDSRAGIVQLLIRDISRRKLVEQRLTEAKRQAEEANQAKSHFIANMSHEIRTPMNAILGFTEVLLRETENREHSSYLAIIQKSGTTLLKLINDILDISKIEAGKLAINPSPVDLRELGNEILEMFSVACEEKNLRLSVAISEDIPGRVLLDGVRIRQILFNLVGNAVKFTEKGSIDIKVWAAKNDNQTLDLSFQVRDTGMGIPEDQQQEIFKAFQQARDQDFNRFGGTGLGLTITRRLAELMGGEILLDSEPGGGSTFTLLMHEVAPYWTEEKEGPERPFVDEFVFQDAVVLAVDDKKVNLLLIRKYLEAARNLRLVTESDGRQILSAVERFRPDLILLSLDLSGTDGYGAIRELRSNPRFADIPVIGITASIVEDSRETAVRAGFSDLLIKPVDLAGLMGLLKRHIPLLSAAESEHAADTPVTAEPGSGSRGDRTPAVAAARKEIAEGFLDQWSELSNSYYIEDIETFAERVGRAAAEVGDAALVEWSGRLQTAAATVDVAQVEKLMQAFPGFLESGAE